MDKNMVNDEILEKVVGGSTSGSEPTPLDIIAQRAYGCLGKPYEWGAGGPNSFDCSGLVCYCLFGVPSHIYTTANFLNWDVVSDPQPGDICTNSYHCGIYMGGGQMIHAPQPGEVVKISGVQGGMKIVRRP